MLWMSFNIWNIEEYYWFIDVFLFLQFMLVMIMSWVGSTNNHDYFPPSL